MFKKSVTKEQALQKLKQFCAYQERSHSEVHEKLYDLGIWKNQHDEIIASLIEDDYLNEERFAIAYAGGKFRIKQWGKIKIRYALKQKQVSEYCIKKSLQQIDDEAYLKTLNDLAEKRYQSLKGEQYLIRKKKTIDYLVQRGYEPRLVVESLNKI